VFKIDPADKRTLELLKKLKIEIIINFGRSRDKAIIIDDHKSRTKGGISYTYQPKGTAWASLEFITSIESPVSPYKLEEIIKSNLWKLCV
jgi:hypothetical protein